MSSSAAWYAANREEINARRRERYRIDAAHRARVLAAVKAYREANPEKARAAVRRWHVANGFNAAYKAGWRERNRGKVREYARLDRHLRRVGDPVDPEFARVLLADPCAYCSGSAGELDHIVPVRAGGGNDEGNLTATCRGCNRRKSSRSLLHFLMAEAAER